MAGIELKIVHMIIGINFLHDIARFVWLARAHCPAGVSDLVHFVVKIVVEKVGSEKMSMLFALLCNISFSVLFLKNPQTHL